MSETTVNLNEQAREAERAVLGGLMLETERFDTVIQVINENDFQGKDHQIIFQSMSELIEDNKPLDPITVSEQLDNKNSLNKVGGKNYLIELATSTPTAANLEAYAEIIRQRSISRKLMQANVEIGELIKNPQGLDGESLLDEAERRIFALNDEASKSDSSLSSMKDLIPRTIDRLHELSNKRDGLIGSSTGFKDLDKKLQGLQKGDLVVVAGRPSMGKTSFAMNIAENVLLDEESKGAVLIFSLEMSKKQIIYRLLSMETNISQLRLRSGKLYKTDWIKLNKSIKIFSKLPLFIDDTSNLSIYEIRSQIKTINSRYQKIGLVIIDYLQLMQNIKSKNEKKAFTDKWIGNKNFSKGERDNVEMKMCFGDEKEPDFFLGNNNFDQLSYRLYGPLIKALKK